MTDMQSIATAWEARATDINSYSVATRDGTRVTAADLARALEPKYITKLPRVDAWGTDFQFTATGNDYTIRSFGSDRQPDRVPNAASGATRNPADDIIYSNGSFIRYPEASG